LWVLLVVVILGVTAAVAVGRGGAMARAYPDRREIRLPANRLINADDLRDIEFSVVFRGYRMDEVDDVIRRLVRDLRSRDARLEQLQQRLAAAGLADESDQKHARTQDQGTARRSWLGPMAQTNRVPQDERSGQRTPTDQPDAPWAEVAEEPVDTPAPYDRSYTASPQAGWRSPTEASYGQPPVDRPPPYDSRPYEPPVRKTSAETSGRSAAPHGGRAGVSDARDRGEP